LFWGVVFIFSDVFKKKNAVYNMPKGDDVFSMSASEDFSSGDDDDDTPLVVDPDRFYENAIIGKTTAKAIVRLFDKYIKHLEGFERDQNDVGRVQYEEQLTDKMRKLIGKNEVIIKPALWDYMSTRSKLDNTHFIDRILHYVIKRQVKKTTSKPAKPRKVKTPDIESMLNDIIEIAQSYESRQLSPVEIAKIMEVDNFINPDVENKVDSLLIDLRRFKNELIGTGDLSMEKKFIIQSIAKILQKGAKRPSKKQEGEVTKPKSASKGDFRIFEHVFNKLKTSR
jgi:hypothetical protein